jgi:two-component system OmpR family response regulator
MDAKLPESPNARVLVGDDEQNITELLAMAFRYEGFDVEEAASGGEALERVSANPPSLIVLDVMMPGMDGFEVVKKLREQGRSTPVLFLTAKDTTKDAVEGLTLGADDYVTKPFSLEEVIARARAVLRRTSDLADEGRRLVVADLVMDDDTREVWRAGEQVELTDTEYRLLRYLLANPRRVLTRQQILQHVWNYDFGGDGRVLETYVSYLRKKVDQAEPPLIHTVRGVGYTLRVPAESGGSAGSS